MTFQTNRYNRYLAGQRHAPFLLLWKASPQPDLGEIDLPLAWHSRCEKAAPIALFRTDWKDPNGTFFGLKGGTPSGPHGHMDIGSFVLDADGVHWAMDFGMESYHGVEARGMQLWQRHQESDRWKIFRINHLSHNLLLINEQPQIVAGFGPIDRFSDDPEFPYAQIDLTPVYQNQASSMRRGMAMLPGGAVLIRDEIEGVEPGAEVRWAMLTRADPDTLGEQNLLLTRQGQKLRLLQPVADALWTVVLTDPPPSEWDSRNRGTRMVALKQTAPEDGKVTFTVVAVPGTFSEELPSASDLLRPLSDW